MQLTKITIAPIKVNEMVQFYNSVFDSQLKPFQAFGTTLYSGKLAGLELLFCPNEILDIRAEKNRQQLTFTIDNFEAIIKSVQNNGGELMGDIQKGENGRACGIKDPDGNSIEIIEIG